MASSTTAKNIIKGNKFIGGSLRLDGLGNSTSDDNQVISNTIISSSPDGILIVGKQNVIRGNTINQSEENGIVVDSFKVNFGSAISEGNIIKDNSITNSGESGIKIESERSDGAVTLNTVIIDNTLAGNTNSPIDDDGDGTTQAGNIFGN